MILDLVSSAIQVRQNTGVQAGLPSNVRELYYPLISSLQSRAVSPVPARIKTHMATRESLKRSRGITITRIP